MNRGVPPMSHSARVRSCLLSDADRSFRPFEPRWAPRVASGSGSSTTPFKRIISICWWKRTRRRPLSAVSAGWRCGSQKASTVSCAGKAAFGRPGITRACFALRAKCATRSSTCSTIGASTSQALRASIRAPPGSGSTAGPSRFGLQERRQWLARGHGSLASGGGTAAQ
jgi:hypothetical protein